MNTDTKDDLCKRIAHDSEAEERDMKANTEKFLKRKRKYGEQTDEAPQYSYYQLFRYATTTEWLITILGVLIAASGAFTVPIDNILYGEITALFVDRIDHPTRTTSTTNLLPLFGGGRILTNGTIDANSDALKMDSLAFAIFIGLNSLIKLICCTVSISLVNYSGLKQISRLRKTFLSSVLRQEMAWFDQSGVGNFATRLTDNLEKIKDGISEKLAIFTYLFTTFMVLIMFSLYYGWELTLIVLSCTPFSILSNVISAKIFNTLTQKELASYSSAGEVADEVLGGIRTVTAFGGEQKEADRYKSRLRSSVKSGHKKGLYSGVSGGIGWTFMYWSYAIAFWYGAHLITDGRENGDNGYTTAIIVVVLFSILTAVLNIGAASPHLETFTLAKSAASSVFSIIDRESKIDALSQHGLRPTNISGNIEFNNVHFRYPARLDVPVLNGLNLVIKKGQSVALVGPSGCGKSTCLQLIQRLYDATEGSILFEGVSVTDISTSWLRSCIGVVGQEPVLFATTIADNIRYGNAYVSMEGIQDAAKIANCHEFIQRLPKGYDTVITDNSQLSGGQKQRIAIARALVRNPRILLLDEATSALDPSSEKRVQQALDRASKGRTTIVVSHRLSTITNADRIVYIDGGVVVEDGTHKELLDLKGFYYDLVSANNSNYVTKKDTSSPPHNTPRSRLSSISPSGDSNSGEGDDEDEDEGEGEEKSQPNVTTKLDTYPVSMMRIIRLNKDEWPYILLGCIGAVVMGASLPTFAIIFGEYFEIMSTLDDDELQEGVNWLSTAFILLGIMAGLSTFLQIYMMNLAGSRLTLRLREKVFEATLRQEMGWFDRTENSVGALSARLSGDCSSVQGATGSRIGSVLQSIATIAFGVGVSFYFSCHLTLVAIIFVPIVVAACFFESRYMATSNLQEKRALEAGCRMAVEAITQIRTVASLGQERYVIKRFNDEMEKAEQACRTKIRYRGLVFSFGQAMPFFGYALCVGYGGMLVADGYLPYKNVIKISEALIYGSWMLGQSLAYAPNVHTAITSAGRLLRILDRLPQYNNPSPKPYNSSTKTEGTILYTDLNFHYPTRTDVPVLRGLNLDIKKGQTVALVGPSGCGKSTCIQLLLRYYDPLQGTINLDGTATTDFPIAQLRSHLGLVSQEPVLFDRTIAENIAYGDSSRDIPLTEIIEAAKMANIHTFIAGLPLGYETRLGKRGTQLSGGQKQRIAIARALIRNPSILLLDEATSALDSQSENVVQAALDKARAGRTCITIAHRLTTIQNADVICVINGGVVIEKGTHNELMTADRTYAELYRLQQVDD